MSRNVTQAMMWLWLQSLSVRPVPVHADILLVDVQPLPLLSCIYKGHAIEMATLLGSMESTRRERSALGWVSMRSAFKKEKKRTGETESVVWKLARNKI